VRKLRTTVRIGKHWYKYSLLLEMIAQYADVYPDIGIGHGMVAAEFD